MKLSKILSLSLAGIVSAATIYTGVAFADEELSPTVYPESFECSLSFDGGLTDYAVFEDSYAFAYNGQLAVLSSIGNNHRIPDIKPVSSITQLEYSAQGELYVCFADGYCIYPDLTQKYPLSEITVQDKEQWQVSLGEITYSLNNENGSLLYMSKSGFATVTVPDAEGSTVFSKLKKFDGVAYAVMNNCLYRLNGASAELVNPTYYGFVDMTKAISTGTAAQALKGDTPISYGWLEKDKYYTRINLENELGSTFDVPDPATATALSADRLFCTVLAESGNAYIIIVDGVSYITAKASVSIEATPPALSPADTQAAYAMETTGVYSRPYLSPTTKLCELESGSSYAVTVLGQYTDLAGNEYYKVTYTGGDGSTVTGYVAKRLMTTYAFPAEDDEVHTDGGDEQFVYDNNFVTVALAVAIVGLVLIAILYVGIASSRNSKPKGRQKSAQKKKRPEPEKRSSYDDDDYDEE
ncbi:MAG: hypothetical protein ACI4QI_05320 [Candidatus Coproplasma sp.]